MVSVYLAKSQLQRCRDCAERRQANHSDPNRPNYNADTDPYRNMMWEIRGAMGELACALYLGMSWSGEHERGQADVGGSIEVRTTQPGYRLAIVDKDLTTHQPLTPYVSAVWDGCYENVIIELRGWHLLGDIAEIMTSQMSKGHKFYTVENSQLRPMADLKALT
jgi:hypothetical protein